MFGVFSWDAERINRLTQMATDGYTKAEAAAFFGVSYEAVRKKAEGLGIKNWAKPALKPRTTRIDWTPEAVKWASEQWIAGKSAAFIASGLGYGNGRNAVIGKMHRLGLKGRNAPGFQPGNIGGFPRPATAPPPRKIKAKAIVAAPVEPAHEGGVTLMELKEHSCRYPFGDPRFQETFRYCGNWKPTDTSWCAACSGIVYDSARTRASQVKAVA